ncbi:MAG: PD-(D/E)XK nuclease-like domain-containing protein [Candidatus Heimdallarchaeaceae archaeon]
MKGEANILKKLKDDTQYYGEFGQQFLSNSDIKDLLNNPAEFKKPTEEDKALVVGRYFHQCILEPEKAKEVVHVDVSSRNTKAYKEMIIDQQESLATLDTPILLLTKEKEEVDEMVRRMKGNFKFFDSIYADGNKFELPAVGNIMGVAFKGKADIVCNDCLIDLKTTSDISKFKWSCNTYNYDSQCYIYQVLFGKPLKFYVIDKQTLLMGKFTPTQAFVDRGREKVSRAVEVYNRFYGEKATEDVLSYYIEEELY